MQVDMEHGVVTRHIIRQVMSCKHLPAPHTIKALASKEGYEAPAYNDSHLRPPNPIPNSIIIRPHCLFYAPTKAVIHGM